MKRVEILLIASPIIILVLIVSFIYCMRASAPMKNYNNDYIIEDEKNVNPIVKSARKQIGVVTKYDTGYYQGGYPPDDSGACVDVIIRALLDNNYNLKDKIDNDFKSYPERYGEEIDENINFRRVKNVKIFFDNYAQSLTTEINKNTLSEWQAGDVVTYEKMVGGLWHIAIISNRKNKNGTPLLIHNHGFGTTENDLLLNWPAKISGHYRINL